MPLHQHLLSTFWLLRCPNLTHKSHLLAVLWRVDLDSGTVSIQCAFKLSQDTEYMLDLQMWRIKLLSRISAYVKYVPSCKVLEEQFQRCICDLAQIVVWLKMLNEVLKCHIFDNWESSSKTMDSIIQSIILLYLFFAVAWYFSQNAASKVCCWGYSSILLFVGEVLVHVMRLQML